MKHLVYFFSILACIVLSAIVSALIGYLLNSLSYKATFHEVYTWFLALLLSIGSVAAVCCDLEEYYK